MYFLYLSSFKLRISQLETFLATSSLCRYSYLLYEHAESKILLPDDGFPRPMGSSLAGPILKRKGKKKHKFFFTKLGMIWWKQGPVIRFWVGRAMMNSHRSPLIKSANYDFYVMWLFIAIISYILLEFLCTFDTTL